MGGPSDRASLGSGLTVTKLAVGAMDNNAYLLSDRHGEGLVIDAADKPARLIGLIGGTPLAADRHHPPARRPLAGAGGGQAATGATTLAPRPTRPASRWRPTSWWTDGDAIGFGDTVLS